MSTPTLYRQQGIHVYRHLKSERQKGGGLRIFFRFLLNDTPAPSVVVGTSGLKNGDNVS